MSRWTVQNIDYDYDWAGGESGPLKRMAHDDRPWEVRAPDLDSHSATFATHAEAITYADTQARRTA